MSQQLIVTQAGLNAAMNAAQQGITIKLSTFAVGSAYGYQATPQDTALHGTVLYQDNITSYSTVNGTLNLECTISVQAGPFEFGEVGVYMDNGTLFALVGLDQLYEKYSSLGTNIATTYTFNLGIKLGQSTAIVEVAISGQGVSALVGTNLDIGPGNFVVDTEGRVVTVEGQSPGNFAWRMQASAYFNAMLNNPVVVNYDNGSTVTNAVAFAVGNGQGAYSATVTYAGDMHANSLIAVAGLSAATVSATNGTIATLQSTTITATSISGGTVTQASDRRLKDNVVRIHDAMAVIRSLNGYYYTRLDNGDEEMGLMAQEALEKAPRLVRTREGGTYTMMYGNTAALFVEALKEKDDQIQVLMKDVEDLKKVVTRLKSKVRSVR